jgi:hypothetical protein
MKNYLFVVEVEVTRTYKIPVNVTAEQDLVAAEALAEEFALQKVGEINDPSLFSLEVTETTLQSIKEAQLD